jgi:hypothetical protein
MMASHRLHDAKSTGSDWKITIDTKPSATCAICQTPVDSLVSDDASAAVTLAACGHSFHSICFSEWAVSRITDAQMDFECFVVPATGSKQCGAPIARSEIDAVIPDSMRRKFEVFQYFHDHPHDGRQCSKV